MKITELNRDQLIRVKESYYTQKMAELGKGVSYGELAMIDDIVSDEEIYKELDFVVFTDGDFE